jgi:long-chain acyl-CoA synthetase
MPRLRSNSRKNRIYKVFREAGRLGPHRGAAALPGHSRGDGWAAGQPVGAAEEAGLAEQVRRFRVLADEWTAETGELTPTLKRRRRVIADRYASQIDQLYQ